MFRESFERIFSKTPYNWREYGHVLSDAAERAAPEDLPEIARVARMDGSHENELAWPAMVVLAAWGEPGVAVLREMGLHGPHSSTALDVLSALALGGHPFHQGGSAGAEVSESVTRWQSSVPIRRYVVPNNLTQEAIRALRAIVLESPDMLSYVRGEKLALLVDLLVDSHRLINQSVIEGFRALLNAELWREEDLHQYLEEHPTLLDPLALEVITKHQLGSEFVADFAIRRLNDEYVIIQIETSKDALFTKEGISSVALNRAISQVTELQWLLRQNVAYAEKYPHGIRYAAGLVVIGRKRDLDQQLQNKLTWKNAERGGRVKIATYDDLLSQAEIVYRNTLEKPRVYRTKERPPF